MAEDTGAVHDATLIDVTLPLAPGLVGRLEHGIDVADIGCGSGHAINLMAEAFPRSRLTGFDFGEASPQVTEEYGGSCLAAEVNRRAVLLVVYQRLAGQATPL